MINPVTAVLFRGWEEYKKLYSPVKLNVHGMLDFVHSERVIITAGNLFDPANVARRWLEMFVPITGYPCPCCNCLRLHSGNYMEMPEWVIRQEHDQQNGQGSYDRAKLAIQNPITGAVI